MKLSHIFTLFLILLLSACSERKEESKPAEDTSAGENQSDVALAQEPTVAGSATADTKASQSGSVNYLPVLLETIEGAEEIAKLQREVQAIQALQRQRAELKSQIGAASNPEERSELQASLSRLEGAFTEQNDLLKQAYGIDFASPNEYVFAAQKTEVLVQAEAESTSTEVAADGDGFVVTKVLEGSDLIRQFLSDLEKVKRVRAHVVRLRQALAAATEEDVQAGLSAKINEATEIYQQNNRAMFEAYGYTFARPSKTRNTELSLYVQPPLPKLNEQAGVPDDYVFIGSLEGVEANLKFKQNLQIMKASRARAQQLAESLAAATDEAKKTELQNQLDTLQSQIERDAKTMLEAYKFSNDRNYRQIVTKARLDIQLTDKEIAAKKAEDPDYRPPENGYVPLITINNADANAEFQKNVQVIERMRQQIVQAEQALQDATNEAEKAELQASIKAATEKLSQANAVMAETYKYSLNRKYQYAVEASDLYLQLTRAEMSEL